MELQDPVEPQVDDEHAEDPEDHIGDEILDPWDDPEAEDWPSTEVEVAL